MKGSYLGFGSPNNRLTCTQGQKTLSLSYNRHLCLPYLLNDSQTINLALCVMLICGDCLISFKAVFVSSVPLCVKPFPGNSYFNAPKGHLVAFYSDQHENQLFPGLSRQLVGNMLMCHVNVNVKRLGIYLKNDSFQWFRFDSFFWETITLYTVHFQIYNFAGCFHSLRAVTLIF